MSVRPAGTDDIGALVMMGRQYHAESPYSDIIGFDSPTWSRTVVGLLDNPNGIVFISDDGFIAGWLGPCWFNDLVTIAHEIGWRDRSGEGLKLLDAFEGEAMDRGASYVLGLNMPGQRDEALERTYLRRGYRLAGAQFIKLLPAPAKPMESAA